MNKFESSVVEAGSCMAIKFGRRFWNFGIMIKNNNLLHRLVFQHLRRGIKSAASKDHNVFYLTDEGCWKVHQWFMIEWCPGFDMLNFIVQDENFAELGVPKNSDSPVSPLTTGQRRKPPQGNANSAEKMSDFPLFLLHAFQRIISSYPRLLAGTRYAG